MGIIACFLFGIIGAWISRSLIACGSGLKSVLIIGLISGALGLLGVALGWGDFESFNLYNVLLSIAFSAVLTFISSKVQPKPVLSE